MTTELPAPDLKDSTGRMRRIVLSLLIAGACSGIAYVIANALIKPETEAYKVRVTHDQMSAGTFVIWVALVVFALSLSAALAIQNALAKKKWRDNLVAKAKVV